MSDQASRHGMRWTPEEHRLFVEALQKHPRGKWEEIAAAIGTRTPRQTRKHAEKLQEKIKRRQRRAADASAAPDMDDESFGDDEEEIALIVDLLRHRSRANTPSAPAEAVPTAGDGLQQFTEEELQFLADLLLSGSAE